MIFIESCEAVKEVEDYSDPVLGRLSLGGDGDEAL